MSRLHEITAVGNDMRGLYAKIVAEAKKTFGERRDHFEGFNRTYKSEVQDDYVRDPEVKRLVTTVPAKLSYIEEQLGKVIDTNFQQEATNCLAKADIIVIDDDDKSTTIATAVPVTVLVQLEKKLSEMRAQVYDLIPTLDPTKKWKWDEANGYYVNYDPSKRVTRKAAKVIEKSPATKEHPAQVELVTVDETTGYHNQTNISGMVTPKKKSDLLERLDKLIHAVKTARARANDAEVTKEKLASKLFKYLNTQEVLKQA
jgi:hypothetical protein